MKTAGAITNRYQDFQVLNLCQLVYHADGRGPYMVTQDGCDPNDPTMRACSFVMTKRGTWLHFYLYLALPQTVREKCAHFETVGDLMRRAESLPARVVLEDAHSLQQLLAEAGFIPDTTDATGRALYEELRRRQISKESQPEAAARSDI